MSSDKLRSDFLRFLNNAVSINLRILVRLRSITVNEIVKIHVKLNFIFFITSFKQNNNQFQTKVSTNESVFVVTVWTIINKTLQTWEESFLRTKINLYHHLHHILFWYHKRVSVHIPVKAPDRVIELPVFLLKASDCDSLKVYVKSELCVTLPPSCGNFQD